jgi:hypothetical protein
MSVCMCDCHRVYPDSLSASKKWVVYAGLADMEDGGCCAAEISGQLHRQLLQQLLSPPESPTITPLTGPPCDSLSEGYYSSFERFSESSAVDSV